MTFGKLHIGTPQIMNIYNFKYFYFQEAQNWASPEKKWNMDQELKPLLQNIKLMHYHVFIWPIFSFVSENPFWISFG